MSDTIKKDLYDLTKEKLVNITSTDGAGKVTKKKMDLRLFYEGQSDLYLADQILRKIIEDYEQHLKECDETEKIYGHEDYDAVNSPPIKPYYVDLIKEYFKEYGGTLR